jgi:pyrimidine-nucleoside phosphorylase
MFPQWIIEKKRDGMVLTPEEIGFFTRGYAEGSIPDYQMAALAMAIAIRGMTFEETAALTAAMLESGAIIDSSAISRPKIDKHSTGGVGDKISLVLAPLVACCGVAAPMIVGRGLGITGGTLDKLESIPGYRTELAESEFVSVVRECGCAIMGASERIAPADRKLYALRDVTGTVPSIPLIVASILSKKLAAGLDGIVFDVKCGTGAFMRTLPEANKLAETLAAVGGKSGLRARALVTDMSQPLGRAVGNALEVIEAVETLQGRGPADVVELTLVLGVEMVMLAGKTADAGSAREELRKKLESGEAFARFKQMVRLQGGGVKWFERPETLAQAGIKEPVRAAAGGYVRAVDAGLIGRAANASGAGRGKIYDAIDHAAGIICLKKIGDPVERGEPLAFVHANAEEKLAQAGSLAEKAYIIGGEKTEPSKLIIGQIHEHENSG